MKNKCKVFFATAVALACIASQTIADDTKISPAKISPTKDSPYTFGKKSRDGIGKFYMNREISHVMGHLGAGWLERPGRRQEERTDLLLANLELKKHHNAADIGAGTGFFSFPMSEQVTRWEGLRRRYTKRNAGYHSEANETTGH